MYLRYIKKCPVKKVSYLNKAAAPIRVMGARVDLCMKGKAYKLLFFVQYPQYQEYIERRSIACLLQSPTTYPFLFVPAFLAHSFFTNCRYNFTIDIDELPLKSRTFQLQCLNLLKSIRQPRIICISLICSSYLHVWKQCVSYSESSWKIFRCELCFSVA